MSAQLGNSGQNFIVGGLVDEDGVIGFFFDFSLGPFLRGMRNTLAAPFFFCVAAFEISALLFFSPLPAALAMLWI